MTMFDQNELSLIRELYENIFDENADNSKEFRNFVDGNPSPLRIKVENWMAHTDRSILMNYSNLNRIEDQNSKINLMCKFTSATELDAYITSFIENNYF